jgi:hypothetical protein
MSDEFDSQDASEKDAKRPSDDVVQTAPVKCRYTQTGIWRKHRRLLPLQEGEFRAAEQP